MQEQRTLHGKLKIASQTVKKYKQQVVTLRRRQSSFVARSSIPERSSVGGGGATSGGCKRSVGEDDVHMRHDPDVIHVLEQLHRRLILTEKELDQERNENGKVQASYSNNMGGGNEPKGSVSTTSCSVQVGDPFTTQMESLSHQDYRNQQDVSQYC